MSSPLTRAALAVALLWLAAPTHAQGKRYALLAGVTHYDSGTFATLKYAENDAVALAGVLKGAGYDEVVVLTTSAGNKDEKLAPTAANLRAALDKLSHKLRRDDLLLVGLSGHGVLWPVLDEKTNREKDESFFCPADARPRSGKTLGELKETMIPLGELFTTLDESGAGVRLLLVDACRDEVRGKGRNIDVDGLPRTRKGTAVLFSCKSGERAFEAEKLRHGVFFHHVITGLNGEAKDKKGKVTWASLVEHVVEKVTEDVPVVIGGGARQTPHEMKNIEGLSPLLIPAPADAAEVERWFREGLAAHGRTDHAEALKWFTKASQRGHAKSTSVLGWMYAEGLGAGRDQGKAVRLFREAAGRGDADGIYNLGRMYADGNGVEQDYAAAVGFFRKAADKGHLHAICALGRRYELGQGVGKDERKAAELYRSAAEKDYPLGAFSMGVMCEAGRGVARDRPEALRWYKKAAALGFAPAQKEVTRLESSRD